MSDQLRLVLVEAFKDASARHDPYHVARNAERAADALLKSPIFLAALAVERNEAYQRGRADGEKWPTPPLTVQSRAAPLPTTLCTAMATGIGLDLMLERAMLEQGKPNIAELEAMLVDRRPCKIVMQPDGSITAESVDDFFASRAVPADLPQVVREAFNKLHRLRPAAEWHEDFGCCIWYRVVDGKMLGEPPYIGGQLDEGFDEDYYTHWSPLPDFDLLQASLA